MDLYFWKINENKLLELVGIIDTATSIQWLERYYENGTFEVYIQVNQDILDIVNQSTFISRNDSTYVGVIEFIQNEDDIDNGNFLIIQGHFAECLIGRRIIRNISYYEEIKGATLFYVCDDLLQKNILNPVLQGEESVSPRKMSCINTSVINQLKTNHNISTQATFENNLLDFLIELLKSYNASIRLELNDDNMFNVVIYEGTDRSYNQEENAYVVFSEEFDNLISSTYSFDSTQEANALYVGGEDNETASEGRFIDKYELPVDDGVISDIDRKEVFINASDLKQNWKDEDTGLEISIGTDEYRELLRARGKENVVYPSEKLDVKVDLSTYIYNQDYFLGDVLTIENKMTHEPVNKRLIGMDIVDDENGHTLEPIFED
jgi:hypothetical protein